MITSKITNDEICIDFTEEKYLFIETYGGEYKGDNIEFSDYGIQIDNLDFKLLPEQAVKLCEKLTDHLRI